MWMYDANVSFPLPPALWEFTLRGQLRNKLCCRVVSRWQAQWVVHLCPLALALAKTDMWEGHAGQTQATSIRMQNPFGFHYLSVTVLSGIPGIW